MIGKKPSPIVSNKPVRDIRRTVGHPQAKLFIGALTASTKLSMGPLTRPKGMKKEGSKEKVNNSTRIKLFSIVS